MTLPTSIINISFREFLLLVCDEKPLILYAELGTCLVSIALSAAAVGYFAALLPVLLGTLYITQNFYLRTSRQLRLLEYVSIVALRAINRC
jgi:hypothetical protein